MFFYLSLSQSEELTPLLKNEKKILYIKSEKKLYRDLISIHYI